MKLEEWWNSSFASSVCHCLIVKKKIESKEWGNVRRQVGILQHN